MDNFTKISRLKAFSNMLAVVSVLMTASCSPISFGDSNSQSSKKASTKQQMASLGWEQGGMAADYRPVPAISSAKSLNGLGFMPSASGNSISINRRSGEVSLLADRKEVASSFGVGANKLSPGTYQVMHKQENAPWYAPDSYYKKRGLPVPPEGDKSRYRRGALGDYVIYLDKSTPIHCGPLWDREIGGVKVREDVLAQIFHSVEIGNRIVVK